MSMQTAYKIVQRKAKRLYSCAIDGTYRTEYWDQETSYPKKEGWYLFAYDSILDAMGWWSSELESGDMELWKVEADVVETYLDRPIIAAPWAKDMRYYWNKFAEKGSSPKVKPFPFPSEYMETPSGTLFCQSIKLLERIPA